MRKRTHITYDEMDVQKIVRDELEKAKPQWVEEITESVAKKVAEFKDEIMEKLDSLMGKFETHDQEHTIAGGQIDDLSERVEKLEQSVSKYAPHAA